VAASIRHAPNKCDRRQKLAKRKAERPPDPDRLVRAEAGRYRTEDERFEVSQESASTWYITDEQRTDDLGLARVSGPYATLASVRTAIVELRQAPDEPVSLEEQRRKRATEPRPPTDPTTERAEDRGAPVADRDAAPRAAAAKAKPKPKPTPSWLDRLGPDEAARARRLIRAAERAGLRDPEHVVRVDLQGLGPQLAPAVLFERVWRDAILGWDRDEVAGAAERGRRALADDADATERLVMDVEPDRIGALARILAHETARRVLEIIASPEVAGELPRWMLDEIDEHGDRTGRRVGLSPEDLDAAAPKG
jgi:hypothetical protein